jgi:hypothetical protein
MLGPKIVAMIMIGGRSTMCRRRGICSAEMSLER